MIRFISDLHLCAERPETTAAFLAFLRGPARDATQLWILGDLFEYWAGDDDLENPFNSDMAAAIGELVSSGVATSLIVGNRDFLLGREFSAATGVEIVAEPTQISLDASRALLMHGDALCTDDHAYMQFREMVRNPMWQAQFLAQPLSVRRKIAEDLRAKSEMAKQDKDSAIMDVNSAAVESVLREHKVPFLIHGHTHRPARHQLLIDGRHYERWVLPDWHETAQWLEWNGATLSFQSLKT